MNGNESPIPAARIRSQALCFYAAPVAWLVFMVVLPALFSYSRSLGIAAMIFPGVWLFTWQGYLMHECWHKYVPSINNAFFYNLFSLLIVTDPQLYSIIHGAHHAQVHTFEDREFHPLGEIRSRVLRSIYNFGEIIFGVAFIVVIASITVPRDERYAKRYRRRKMLLSIPLVLLVFGGTVVLSHQLFGVGVFALLQSYLGMLWVGSFFLHQSQLIEHGNLIVDGDFHQRNIRSRNLRPAGIPEKLFLFLTHNDSREHVLHHTLTRVYSRPFPGMVPLPEYAVMITLGEYLRVLGRMLAGKVDRIGTVD